MSTVAEKAAARRAKILARSKDRMATVTGGMNTSEIPSVSPDALTHDQAEAELERAIQAAMNETPQQPTKQAPAVAALTPRSSVPPPAPVTVVDDPHEFLSAKDANEFSPPPSPSAADDSQLAFASFANASNALTAARRRKQEAAMMDLPPPPTVSALTAWKRRFTSQARKTSPTRAVTVGIVLATAILAGVGWIEGGLVWLAMIEILSFSVGFIAETTANAKKSTGSKPMSSSRPTAATPPPPPSDDPDIIDVDTDIYRTQPPLAPANPFGALNLQSMMGLPPAAENALSVLNVLMKYAQLMKQLMADGMLFVFTCVCVNAIWQLRLASHERVQYV